MNLKATYKKRMFLKELEKAVDIDEFTEKRDFKIRIYAVCEKAVHDENFIKIDTLYHVRFSIVNKYANHNDFSLRISSLGYRKHRDLKWLASRKLEDGNFEHLFSFPIKLTWADSIVNYKDESHDLKIIIPTSKVHEKHFEYDLHHCHCVRDDVYDFWHKKRMDTRIKELESLEPISQKVKFSFIIPFFKTDPTFFDELIDCIKAQTYENWEIVAINASPEDDILSKKIDELKSDERVAVVTLDENKGITLNSAEGVKASSGDFICYCDHDDTIEPTILEEYARAIENDCEIGLLYCDEDLLYTSTDGHLGSPAIKIDYSPVKFACTNYICHMLCVRRDIYDKIAPKTSDFDGAQDYKLTADAILEGAKVHHVAEPLYHWRCNETSTAGQIEQKTYAIQAGRDVTNEFLDAYNVIYKNHDKYPYMPCFYFNDYGCQVSDKLLVVIPLTDECCDYEACLASILNSSFKNMKVVICASELAMANTKKTHDNVEFRVFDGASKSEMINAVINDNDADYVAIVNPNVVIDNITTLDELVCICKMPNVHGCTLRLVDDEGFVVSTKSTFGRGAVAIADSGLPFHAECPEDQICMCDDLMVVKRDDFLAIGGYDEAEFPHTFADADFSLRLRDKIESNGQRCVFVYAGDLTATIHKFPQLDGIDREHSDSWKAGLKNSNVKSERRLFDAIDKFYARHKKRIDQGDPFYSPRLDTYKMNHRFDIEFLLAK